MSVKAQVIEQNPIVALGRERLILLGKHAEAIMQSYATGHIDETQFSANTLEKLMQARILWRPDEQQPLSLRPNVSELIASLTQDERKRQINSDVAEHLDQIHTRVQSFIAARQKADYGASEHHMQLLTERVHDMVGQFGEAIESLWHRLNTEFGFVSSLDDKIREIELAQKQLRRLLDGFAVINFDELILLAGSDGALRKLLVSQLQARISEHSGSLLEVQKRLVLLMGRFRLQQERAQLVSRMSAFLRQHPNFQVGDYPNRSHVPKVVNQAAGITPQGFIALDRTQDNHMLAELVRYIPREPSQPLQPSHEQESFSTQEQSTVANHQKALATDVENLFIAVVDSTQPQSALAYLQQQSLPWDPEIWLFQVVAEYESMASQSKQSFHLQKVTHAHSQFNHLQIIEDVQLGLRFSEDYQAA